MADTLNLDLPQVMSPKIPQPDNLEARRIEFDRTLGTDLQPRRIELDLNLGTGPYQIPRKHSGRCCQLAEEPIGGMAEAAEEIRSFNKRKEEKPSSHDHFSGTLRSSATPSFN